MGDVVNLQRQGKIASCIRLHKVMEPKEMVLGTVADSFDNELRVCGFMVIGLIAHG